MIANGFSPRTLVCIRKNCKTYFKYNLNVSKRVGSDGAFLGWQVCSVALSLGFFPWKIPLSSPASPWKTPFIPPLLLRLTQSIQANRGDCSKTAAKHGHSKQAHHERKSQEGVSKCFKSGSGSGGEEVRNMQQFQPETNTEIEGWTRTGNIETIQEILPDHIHIGTLKAH